MYYCIDRQPDPRDLHSFPTRRSSDLEVQRDHIRGQFIHVDFLTIRRDEKITVDVPVELVGESHGVKEGGVIEHHRSEEHTSELQSLTNLVCRLLLEKKKSTRPNASTS